MRRSVAVYTFLLDIDRAVTHDVEGSVDAIAEGAITFDCPRWSAAISERALDMASRVASRRSSGRPIGEPEGSI